MKTLTYDERITDLRERSKLITQMIVDLTNGEEINFDIFGSLIAVGLASELNLIHENEGLKRQSKNGNNIDDIDVPSFM